VTQPTINSFPSLPLLKSRLATSLDVATVEVIAREPNPFASSSPSEIVTIRASSGDQRRIFCKYVVTDDDDYRRVEHEAKTYRHVVGPSGMTASGLLGTWDGGGREKWIMTEALEGKRVGRVDDFGAAICSAARWAARFHAHFQSRTGDRSLAYLDRWDREYFVGALAGAMHRNPNVVAQHRWLTALADHFGEVLDLLALVPLTVVHGEFYQSNILIANGTIYPIDWQTAAISHGLIDVAMLMEGWDDDVVVPCARAYCEALNGGMPSEEWYRRLDAARVCVAVRWMSLSTPELSAWPSLDDLHRSAQRLEVVDAGSRQ
jgi:hypothetical protein